MAEIAGTFVLVITNVEAVRRLAAALEEIEAVADDMPWRTELKESTSAIREALTHMHGQRTNADAQ